MRHGRGAKIGPGILSSKKTCHVRPRRHPVPAGKGLRPRRHRHHHGQSFRAYDPALSYVADFGGEIVGSVRQTKIRVGNAPALMLGPLAVRPFLKGRGIGKALMRRAAQGATEAGETVILLVGDQPYYWGLGYRPVPPGTIHLPRPVDPARLLALELAPRAMLSLAGRLGRR